MNSALLLIVYTANILGAFSDPFEFEGDYGSDVNPIREKVFERVIPTKEIARDRQHGPTLAELVTSEIIEALKEKQDALPSFKESELQEILRFVESYGDQKVFRFLHNTPDKFLNLDHTLPNKGAKEGWEFSLPILSSMTKLNGYDRATLKLNLLEAVFTEETLAQTKPEKALKSSLKGFDKTFLKELLGPEAESADLQVFCTPAGQTFIYWLYHALNLHLIAEGENLVNEVNQAKEYFAQTLGNATQRAALFRENLIAGNASLLFTQEGDAQTREALVGDGLFHSVDAQNPQDGTWVFLRSDVWEPTYEVISVEKYKGFHEGRINLIVATTRQGERFLLASAHGHSTNAADGRLQVTLIMDIFCELKHQKGYHDLQLLIGMDANTKTEKDVAAFQEHLQSLGLVGTDVGPTTVKKRMLTVQHSKAGKLAIDQEDYLITLQPKHGRKYALTNPTVGFAQGPADPNRMLPDIGNPSDHYPVGATLSEQGTMQYLSRSIVR